MTRPAQARFADEALLGQVPELLGDRMGALAALENRPYWRGGHRSSSRSRRRDTSARRASMSSSSASVTTKPRP